MHRRLLTLISDSRLALTLTILSGLLAGFLTIGQSWLVSGAINGVFLDGQDLAQVAYALRMLLVVIGGRALLAWLSDVSANAVAVRIKTDLRQRLFAHILALGPAYTRRERTGELTTAAVEGIEALDAYYSQYLPQLVVSALVPLSILVFVFPLDPLSGVILLVTAPLIPVFMVMIGKGAEVVTRHQYETLSRLSAHFLDSLQGLTTLKLFGQSKAHAKNIAKVSDQFRDVTLGVLRVTFLSALALELLATLSTAVIAVEIGLRLLYAKMEFREALFLLILAPEFYMPLRMLGARFHAGMAGTTAAKRIYEILDTEISEQRIGNSKGPAPNSPFSILQLSDLSFTYPDETAAALENINLTIRAGQHIALVGASGAGKSTLVNLLLGFIQPTSGQIRTQHETPTTPSSLHLSSFIFHPSIAWVPQRPYLFHDTLAANIKLGKPDASEEEMIEAAQAAHLHEFIELLPDGYQTIVGEGGARLSSGQAQRLAIARAFLKDAPILLLDEPTSSLDTETETLLEKSTRKLMQGKTVITIAHRLNTVFQADQIIVLDSGRIVEQGTHSELLAKKGMYARMVKANDATDEKREVRSEKKEEREENRASQLATLNPQLATRTTHHATRHSSPVTRPILLRLLSFLKGSWSLVALSILLGALTIGASVALMGTSAWLISTAALHPSIAELGVSIVGVRFFGISRGLFRYLERLVSHNVTFRLLARLRTWFYERLEPLAPARLMEQRAGDLLARVIGDVETLENFYVRVVSPPLTAILVGLFTALFLASFDPRLALSLIGFFLALGLILPALAQTLSCRPAADLVTRRADLHAQLVDGIQGLADLLAYGRAPDRLAQISGTGIAYGQSQKRMALITGMQSGFSTLLTNLGLWTVLILTIPSVTRGELSGVMLAPLALLTLASFEAVTPLPLAAQMWNSAREAARRLFEVVDIEPVISEQLSVSSEQSVSSEVRFENLSFSYPGTNTPALQNVTFELQPGTSTAIVGPSGAGKSTLVSLLLRFWEYSSGDIVLGGESLHGLDPAKVRERCAVVTQNNYFFNTSIRENLRLARPSASLAEMEEAARAAHIHEFIAALPKGYDTFIGEQGTRLSGGERQRLAIARALLKQTPILVLDEPTANLDALTEGQVLGTLFHVMRGRTTLLITHRLVGLENVDEILVMEHGRILARGTHRELLAADGLYRRLSDLQNRILRAE
jgi:ATP-binding cassette subfamily C protein CydCD